MKVKKTFWAKIALGFREGYSSKVHAIDEVYKTCHEYCDKVGLCVTVTPTRFIYSKGKGIADGYEDGCFIELINYPRFPQSKYDVVGLAIDLAKIFLKDFSQQRISIIATDNTYLVEQNDLKIGA
jgi:hypothetical protein